MRGWQWEQRMLSALSIVAICSFLTNNAAAEVCRLDWNGDYQIDETDYVIAVPLGGFYPEFYIFMYYPSYYPALFPGADSSRLDYNEDGATTEDDLMGIVSPTEQSEGYYIEWYIFMYYPSYYPALFPEYDVCPPQPVSEGCADWEVIDPGECENAFKVQWELFLKHVAEDAPFRWTLREGAKGVQLAEASLKSDEIGAWVKVE